MSYIYAGNIEQQQFRPQGAKIIPYRIVELSELHRNPIVEVVLGPKHTSPIEIIQKLLAHFGYDSVKVTYSKASYR